jgi:hypothetical protein
MSRLTDRLAVAAFCLSIGTAAFSIFQWWNTEKQNRITAAIELSKNFIKDTDPETVEAVWAAAKSPAKISVNQLTLFAKFGDQLNYIALLANKGRIDRDYLHPSIDCSVIVLAKIAPVVFEKNPILLQFSRAAGPGGSNNLQEYARKADCGSLSQTLDDALSGKTPPQSN